MGKRRGAKRRAARDKTKRSGSASEDGQAARADGEAAARAQRSTSGAVPKRGRTGREEDGQAAAKRDAENTGSLRQGKDPAIPPQGGRVVTPFGEKPP